MCVTSKSYNCLYQKETLPLPLRREDRHSRIRQQQQQRQQQRRINDTATTSTATKRRQKIRITSEREIKKILSELAEADHVHEHDDQHEDDVVERYDELYEPFVDRQRLKDEEKRLLENTTGGVSHLLSRISASFHNLV